MRAFLAITLPSPVLQTLERVREAFIEADASWAGERWVTPDRMHLTLGFFRDLCKSDVQPMLEEIDDLCSRIEPFHAAIGRITPRPTKGSARMLWAGFADGNDDIQALFSVLRPELGRYGASLGRQGFVPHVTLARARRPRPVLAYALDKTDAVMATSEPSSLIVSVSDATLFQSELRQSGPLYSPLGKVGFHSD